MMTNEQPTLSEFLSFMKDTGAKEIKRVVKINGIFQVEWN